MIPPCGGHAQDIEVLPLVLREMREDPFSVLVVLAKRTACEPIVIPKGLRQLRSLGVLGHEAPASVGGQGLELEVLGKRGQDAAVQVHRVGSLVRGNVAKVLMLLLLLLLQLSDLLLKSRNDARQMLLLFMIHALTRRSVLSDQCWEFEE